MLHLSTKLFIPAGTSDGRGGGFSDLLGACSDAVRSHGRGVVSPTSGASLLAAFSFRRALSAADNSSWSKLFCCSMTVSVSANLSFKIPTSD